MKMKSLKKVWSFWEHTEIFYLSHVALQIAWCEKEISEATIIFKQWRTRISYWDIFLFCLRKLQMRKSNYGRSLRSSNIISFWYVWHRVWNTASFLVSASGVWDSEWQPALYLLTSLLISSGKPHPRLPSHTALFLTLGAGLPFQTTW